MFIGPNDPQVAKVQAPETLRAIFGKEGVKNAIYGSITQESADQEIKYFFEGIPLNTDFL